MTPKFDKLSAELFNTNQLQLEGWGKYVPGAAAAVTAAGIGAGVSSLGAPSSLPTGKVSGSGYTEPVRNITAPSTPTNRASTNVVNQQKCAAKPYVSEYSPQFLRLIITVENSIRKGWNKDKELWYPHKSAEGGTDTIAYGHKLKSGENFSKGLTEGQALQLLIADLNSARDRSRQYIDSVYGKYGINFDKLTTRHQEMLIELVYNIGPGGLRTFKSYVKGIVTSNEKLISRNYERSYKNSKGKRLKLNTRNRALYNYFNFSK